jgi:hypothetical protein
MIREDKRRDVAARIAYLDAALMHVLLADQKPELIAVLSEQQQEMMLIASDHLYASKMIDAPYAPRTPTSPSPVIDGLIAFGAACFVWFAMVRMTPAEGRWPRVLAAFAVGRGRAERGGVARSASRFRNDPLADALPIQAVLDGASGHDARGSHGKGHA